MISLKQILSKCKYDKQADRIGPDCPFTHYKLYFKSAGKKLCKKKFMHFADTAEFRPGAYAVSCSTISLGNRVIIRPGTMLFAETAYITIEDDVLLGAGIHIYVNDHIFKDTSIPIYDQGDTSGMDVVIKKGSWIGANSIILKGVTIGENSVVAAGAVVVKDIPDHELWGGCPAKQIKKL